MSVFPLSKQIIPPVLGLTVLGLACGTAAAPTATPPRAAPSPTATATPLPASYGKAVVALSDDPDSYGCDDPIIGSNAQIKDNLFDRGWNGGNLLITQKDGGRGPGLASEWKVSPDGKRIDYTLRQGVTFVNGDPMTMDDVVFSYQRMTGTPPKGVAYPYQFAAIEKMEVIDSTHFAYILKTFDLGVVTSNGLICVTPKAYFTQVGEDGFKKAPIGTGPYRLVSIKPDGMTMEAYAGYWGKVAPTRAVEVRWIPDDVTRAAALQAGEVDLAVPIAPTQITGLKNAGMEVKFYDTWGAVMLTFNARVPPFDNKLLRQAVWYAIDRQGIVNNVRQGVARVYTTVPEHQPGWTVEINKYPYDPAKARALLATTGFKPGQLEHDLWIIGGGRVASAQVIGEVITTNLLAVGLKPNMKLMEYSAYLRKARGDGDLTGITMFGSDITLPPGRVDSALAIRTYYHCKGAWSWSCNPELDKLADAAIANPNEAERIELYKKAVKIINEEAYRITLLADVVPYVYNPKTVQSYDPPLGINQAPAITAFKYLVMKR